MSLFNIDLSEAELPLREYKTIEELFTRRLKSGSRKIAGPVCSPADGVLCCLYEVCNQQLIQAKGIAYKIQEFIFGKDSTSTLESNIRYSFTVYLAPHNYHRVHSPVSGYLKSIRHIPGTLWPVNDRYVQCLPSLFLQNERVVFELELSSGGKAFVVMIGAFNVGRIKPSVGPSFITNSFSRQFCAKQRVFTFDPSNPSNFVEIGNELGVFMLGSTVIVLLDEIASKPLELNVSFDKRPIKMGNQIAFNKNSDAILE